MKKIGTTPQKSSPILRRKDIFILILLFVGVASYFLFFRTIRVNPITERNKMNQLENIKQNYQIAKFESDGCSGNVSKSWDLVVHQIMNISTTTAEKYKYFKNIPFENLCVKHDETYHKGNGGYSARLRADNQLREGIIEFGINNVEEIKKVTSLKTDEEIIFLYEIIAETIYRAVRLGGSPCTGMSYAWGFGYNKGVCD
jgi:hypothetical protein